MILHQIADIKSKYFIDDDATWQENAEADTSYKIFLCTRVSALVDALIQATAPDLGQKLDGPLG